MKKCDEKMKDQVNNMIEKIVPILQAERASIGITALSSLLIVALSQEFDKKTFIEMMSEGWDFYALTEKEND